MQSLTVCNSNALLPVQIDPIGKIYCSQKLINFCHHVRSKVVNHIGNLRARQCRDVLHRYVAITDKSEACAGDFISKYNSEKCPANDINLSDIFLGFTISLEILIAKFFLGDDNVRCNADVRRCSVIHCWR